MMSIGITRPLGPRTGISVKKCYAAHLKDCDGAIEKEHPIPRCALLELFGDEPFEVLGWTSEKISLTKENCSSKVLCARHNRVLGEIDGTLRSWVHATKVMHGEIISSQSCININANKLSLVLLQVSCGLMAITKKEIPPTWIETLFSMDKPVPQLYQMGEVGAKMDNEKKFNFVALERDGAPIGSIFKTKNIGLAFFIGCAPPSQEYVKANKMNCRLKDRSKFRVSFK